jgi:acyl-CoA thioester hydrolase
MTVTPRFYETDAFGHINNITLAGWFEAARAPIFRMFSPNFDIKSMSLILARIEIDYVAQSHYGHDVELKTWIERIGNSSFVVAHEAWQQDALVAKGKAVQVYFDHHSQKSGPIPEEYRTVLTEHVV